MPPFIPRKRPRLPTPEASVAGKGKGKAAISSIPRKPTLFDDLDSITGSRRSAAHGKALLEKLAATSDDDSSLSSLSDEEFEDVPNAKRQKTSAASDENDEDDDIEFEDVDTSFAPGASANIPSGDLELTLTKDTRVSITNPFGTKKGPSKIERGIRTDTHKVHIQLLMWHNSIRNGWCCDKELQEILVNQLGPREIKAVGRWKRDSGIELKQDEVVTKPASKSKGKGKDAAAKGKKSDPRSQRDWGIPATHAAQGQVNMSQGDPLFKLLRDVIRYWKQRFRIKAPGLRKLGYMSLQRLDEEVKSLREEYDVERHGEVIENLTEFRACATSMEGSRDVGAQLFTALLRGLGLEARMIASLQPAGFGWSQFEEASEKNPRSLRKSTGKTSKLIEDSSSDVESDDDDMGSDEGDRPKQKLAGKRKAVVKGKPKQVAKATKRVSSASGRQDAPIDLSASEELAQQDESDDSIIDITPGKVFAKKSLPYDKDLLFPHYWTEVLSPVTHTYTPVDAVVLGLVATGKDTLEKFETRGSKSEKAKQVTAYIIGHASDGTAKDVTTRYLKRHVWPGRTKGNRCPVEKIAIRNQHGKVKRYEEYDWFKTVMSGYTRGSKKYPRTEIDDHEDATDLRPVKPEKKEVEEGKETLQYYKSSPKYVLARHLKREEALLLGATHVKMFTVRGKGETTTEEEVYLRKDVVNCKSMETWHKEGRAPKVGEEPLKRVPYRAATTNRRRELAEAENASGEKVLQGLYSWDQTDWIIPPPIQNGIIPKNTFGNIDLYVDSMLPEGASHLPMRGMVKICKRLEIDYAEAVTGFEFGHRMAVPVITGVVIAQEHVEAVMDEWQKDEAERVKKEDEKRRKAVFGMWRKLLMGLRIVERVKAEYGNLPEGADQLNPFANHKKRKADADTEARKKIMDQRDEEMAGGFLPEGYDAEEPEEHGLSFFPAAPEDHDEEHGRFVVEGHDEPAHNNAYATPQSLHSMKKLASHHVTEDDTEIQDVDAEEPVPPSRKRGRPLGSSAAKPKVKASKKSTPKTKISTSKQSRKRKSMVQDSELDEDEGSPLSELERSSGAGAPASSRKHPSQRASARCPAVPAPKLGARNTPRRTAAKKSETALRSHYFEHDDEDDD